LTQLSGEAATGAQSSGFQLMTSFLALLTGPTGSLVGGGIPALPFGPERPDAFPSDVSLAYASVLKAPPLAFVPHWNSWGATFAGSNSTSGDPSGLGSHDLGSHIGGLAAGLDYHASPDTIFGFALAGGGTSWSLSAGLGGGRSDVFLTGVYGTKQSGNGYLSAALIYASYFMSTSRTIAIAAPDTLSASFNAQNFGARMEGGLSDRVMGAIERCSVCGSAGAELLVAGLQRDRIPRRDRSGCSLLCQGWRYDGALRARQSVRQKPYAG
jgi:Autotransporter beta-domain